MPEAITNTITPPADVVQTAEQIATELAADEAAAKAVAAGETPADPKRPEWLPEKFSSPEDMAKAYGELEKKQSSSTPPSEAPQEQPQEGLGISKDAAEKAAENAGLDFDALAAKYAESGKLEDADYEAMEKTGLKRDTVDAYIRGQQAIADQFEAKVLEGFGDKEAYQSMVQWASTNLPDSAIDMFNEATSSGDVDKALFAINGLKAQYVAANGSEPARQLDGKPTQGGPRYENEAEYVKDIENPDYWKDPAYRARVDRKFASTWGG